MLNLLIRLREEDGLDQSDLEKLAGESQGTIGKYELEGGEFPVSAAKRIAGTFDVDQWKSYEWKGMRVWYLIQ